LQFGRYTLTRSQTTEFGNRGEHCDIIIDEFWVNESTKKACDQLNEIIRIVNRFLDGRKKTNRLVKWKPLPTDRFPEYRLRAGKITNHIARLGADRLAFAYKEKGYKVTKWDVAGHMNEDNHNMRNLVWQYRQHLADTALHLQDQEINDMRRRLERVDGLINISDSIRINIWNEKEYCKDPILKVLRTEGSDSVLPPKWQDYNAKLLPDWPFSPQEYEASTYHCLEILARRSTVKTLNWISPEIAEVMLNDHPTTYFVSPLIQVDELSQHDQITIGDIAILMGHYLVIAEQVQERSQEDMLFMTNCLRITTVVEKDAETMRGGLRQPRHSERGAHRGLGDVRVPCRFV
jgi:hypothetical protein